MGHGRGVLAGGLMDLTAGKSEGGFLCGRQTVGDRGFHEGDGLVHPTGPAQEFDGLGEQFDATGVRRGQEGGGLPGEVGGGFGRCTGELPHRRAQCAE
jgi:hypothetical protein